MPNVMNEVYFCFSNDLVTSYHMLASHNMGNVFLVSYILVLLINCKISETRKTYVILYSGQSDNRYTNYVNMKLDDKIKKLINLP